VELMQRIKEFALNSVLAVLVILSFVLSYQVWFPSHTGGPWRTREAHVQSSPPPQSGGEPDVHRPERIYVQNKEGQVALLVTGSPGYGTVWNGLKGVLKGLEPLYSQLPPDGEDEGPVESITAVLPVPLMLNQWAQEWAWDPGGLPNASLKVDRVTVTLSKTPMLHLSGANGGVYRVGPLSATDQHLLTGLVGALDPGLYRTYRPLEAKDLAVKLTPGLSVPDIAEMPVGAVTARQPDATVEQARYFPDLSVVRHIEERDANSFTDGPRWLRLKQNGQIEYVTAPPVGVPPDLLRAREAAKAWVPAHGGWSQDLALGGYFQQQAGRALLVYDLRLYGNGYPVETASPEPGDGALVLELTNLDQTTTVLQYRRDPEFTPLFTDSLIPIQPAEKVLAAAAERYPTLFLLEGEVREMYLGYLIWQPDKLTTWKLIPVWITQVGEKRIYWPASQLGEMDPFVAGI
jgi:hypothetical protein